MSVRLLNQAFGLDLESGLKFVVCALADTADDESGELWPTVAFVAWKTCQSERQVQRAIKYLRDAGALLIVDREGGGRRRSVYYRLDLDALPRLEPFQRNRRGISPLIRRESAQSAQKDGAKGAIMSPFSE